MVFRQQYAQIQCSLPGLILSGAFATQFVDTAALPRCFQNLPSQAYLVGFLYVAVARHADVM